MPSWPNLRKNEENYKKNLNEDKRSPRRDLNPGIAEYEARELTTL